ncbi:hypothetical protein I4U23_000811 [Adineta vaga]|nr:hypothetical protein I4U23_000811 [Adineta vaga]
MTKNPLSKKHDLRDLYPIVEDIPLEKKSQLQLTNLIENNETEENLIDFILVYEEETLSDNINDINPFQRAQKAMRKNFEANLQNYGLILNYRTIPLKYQRQRVFVLITTPFEKLLEMAEITRTYLPFDRINPILRQLLTYPSLTYGIPQLFLPNSIVFQENNQRSSYIFYPYSKRLHKKFARYFIQSNSQTLLKTHTFTIAQRTRLTYEILSRMPLLPPATKKHHSTVLSPDLRRLSPLNLSTTTFQSLKIHVPSTTTSRASFSSIPHDDIIEKLNDSHRHPILKILSSHQYAYGINILIQIGIYSTAYSPHEEYKKNSRENTRKLLYLYWAQIKHIFKIQPIELIRAYFGENIALYFVFLGWYTFMLLLPSIIGCFVVVYSIINVFFDIPTLETCNGVSISMEYLCPQRTRKKYVSIGNDCLTKRFSTIFDNYSTQMFGVFMIFWILCLRRFWQRYLARFQYQWSVCTYLFSINSILFVILDFIFGYIAHRMTDFERHRYQSDFEASLTLKLFIFAFANYYSVPIYIAFFKPWIPSLPGNQITGAKSYFVFTERLEPCNDLTGCSYEISVILLITLIGKQSVNAIIEIITTKLSNSITYFHYHKTELNRQRSFTSLTGNRIEVVYEIRMYNFDVKEKKLLVLTYPKDLEYITDDVTDEETSTRERETWETDIYLQRLGRWQLYNEYIEIMVQYGFIAMFSIALPIAPFLAMINNLFELRTDASKILFEFRRPFGELAYTLGIWEKIFDALSKLAILANILYLLITCDLISKLFYIYIDKNISLKNYINFTLSYFYINDLDDHDEIYQGKQLNITFCRYRDFRYDYGKYSLFDEILF